MSENKKYLPDVVAGAAERDRTGKLIDKKYATNSRVDEVQEIAEGAQVAKKFNTYEEMIESLNNEAETTYKIGQNFYIVTDDVPDLWVSNIESTSVAYTYESDEKFVSELKTNSDHQVQVGYYKLAKLETGKVNLEDYVEKELVEGTDDRYKVLSDNNYTDDSKKQVDRLLNRIELNDYSTVGYREFEVPELTESGYYYAPTGKFVTVRFRTLQDTRQITLNGDYEDYMILHSQGFYRYYTATVYTSESIYFIQYTDAPAECGVWVLDALTLDYYEKSLVPKLVDKISQIVEETGEYPQHIYQIPSGLYKLSEPYYFEEFTVPQYGYISIVSVGDLWSVTLIDPSGVFVFDNTSDLSDMLQHKLAKISEIPDIIDDSELNEYMLSSGAYKPLTNNEGNIFKLNDNTILIL